jgi:hypothetical protein
VQGGSHRAFHAFLYLSNFILTVGQIL